jgi:mannose-6-phosphate isomerase
MQKIIKFNSLYKKKIWGGRKLESVGRSIPSGKIGESWEISDFETDISLIENGELKGMSLRECFAQYKVELFGEAFSKDSSFPLLVKIIDAEDRLSVQVHPSDTYTKLHDPTNRGKKEAWFVLDANDSAEIVCGFSRTLTKEEYKKLIQESKAEEPLYTRNTKKGDVFLIEPGTVHAIGPGNLILEIQQSSDSTYRVYDYGRLGDDGKPRTLHLEKALDVLNFKRSTNTEILKPIKIQSNPIERFLLTSNDKFRIEKFTLTNDSILPNMFTTPAFHILTLLEGEIEIEGIVIKKNDTILLTAAGIQEGIGCKVISKAEVAYYGSGTDWLKPSGVF